MEVTKWLKPSGSVSRNTVTARVYRRRPVRFDERGEETERCRMAQATAPLLNSTRSRPNRCIAATDALGQ